MLWTVVGGVVTAVAIRSVIMSSVPNKNIAINERSIFKVSFPGLSPTTVPVVISYSRFRYMRGTLAVNLCVGFDYIL